MRWRRGTPVTTRGAMHPPAAPRKNTVRCELKFVAVAIPIGTTLPMNAKRIARSRCLALNGTGPIARYVGQRRESWSLGFVRVQFGRSSVGKDAASSAPMIDVDAGSFTVIVLAATVAGGVAAGPAHRRARPQRV